MMYGSKFVAAIKVDGKVLREFVDQVFIPFGSKYSIFLKNLETRRVSVQVNLDGKEAVKGSLILEPGQEIDLERYVGESLDRGNRFKFIERTPQIEKHRGIGAQDGLLTIRFEFEKQWPSATPLNDVGITVPGSESNQKFARTSYFRGDGSPNTLVFHLRGATGKEPVVAPVTVKTKVECPTCGTSNKATSKFCSECGTSLQTYN